MQHRVATGESAPRGFAKLTDQSKVTSAEFVQHFSSLLEKHTVEQFEVDMTQLLDTARVARITRATSGSPHAAAAQHGISTGF